MTTRDEYIDSAAVARVNNFFSFLLYIARFHFAFLHHCAHSYIGFGSFGRPALKFLYYNYNHLKIWQLQTPMIQCVSPWRLPTPKKLTFRISRTSSTNLFRQRLMLRASPIPLGLSTRVMRNLQTASPGFNYRRWELGSSRHRAHR